MDLGKAKLPRTGLNTLHQAIHPVHGIAWTDGKQVCLTSLYFANGDLQFGDTNVIGQFEHVLGLYWGPLCCSGSPALLAVEHKKHVTVWQLQLSSLEQSKLLCTQTCETSEPFPLLSQGCIWHPRSDILAVLTKRDASVLFSVRVDNRRVRADIRGNDPIHCACWTRDGTRLVLAIGTTLHSYIWNDIQRTLTACTYCPLFDVGGYICAIDSTEQAQVAVATELPLDRTNVGGVCNVPSDSEPLRSQLPVSLLEGEWSPDPRRRSFDSERLFAFGSVSTPPYGSDDMVHILAKHRRSDPSPLLHLKSRDHSGSSQESSHLVLVTYERKVTTVRKVIIPGILVPDILAFDASGRIVAVASNSCNMVLVYGIMAAAVPNMQQIQLQKNERPKGVCFLNDRSLLLMVGKQKSGDPAFLPSSNNTEKYVIRLVTKELIYNEGVGPLATKCSESDMNSYRIRRNFSREESPGIKDHAPLEASVIQSPRIRRKSSAEIKNGDSERSSSHNSQRGTSTSPIAVENFDMDHIKRMASLAAAGQVGKDPSSAGPPRLEVLDRMHSDATQPRDSCLPKERALDELSQKIEKLFTRFTELQQCLSEITDFTRNGRKFTRNYPLPQDPPFVNITCQKQLSENVFIDERRSVLLCENKLHLGVVRDLFNLSVVEMMHGPLWIILVEDAEGFVPLNFIPDSELTVRNGKRKMADSFPREAEVPSPAGPDSQSADT
ncbi:WD repeat and coiled-coil-containing protein-like [Conger conger]|uniref:WD repeat and coiled-coil-containing protein-like n=1 Tax=Conger conger TaxID=82655 RepID=UPI002A5AF334|nr:WD repeat and coiled-coil-containing protein-like [Conger conger]